MFTTRIADLYELDLGTIPWGHDPVDLNWQIVDANGNSLAPGNWKDQTFGTSTVTLTRYRPRPGLRQLILVSVPQGVGTSEAAHHISLLPRDCSGICRRRAVGYRLGCCLSEHRHRGWSSLSLRSRGFLE